MSHPIVVTDATFAREVEGEPGLSIVDVWAPWCGPCRMIAPLLDQLAADYDGQVKFAKLDADENVATTVRFNVRSMPTLLFFRGGVLVDRIVGAVPRTRIEAALRQQLAAAA